MRGGLHDRIGRSVPDHMKEGDDQFIEIVERPQVLAPEQVRNEFDVRIEERRQYFCTALVTFPDDKEAAPFFWMDLLHARVAYGLVLMALWI